MNCSLRDLYSMIVWIAVWIYIDVISLAGWIHLNMQTFIQNLISELWFVYSLIRWIFKVPCSFIIQAFDMKSKSGSTNIMYLYNQYMVKTLTLRATVCCQDLK